MLVELVEDDLRFGAALELDDDAHAVTIALIAHVGDIVDGLLVDELGDALDEDVFVDLVGNLADDDGLATLGHVLSGAFSAHEEAAAAGFVGLGDAAAAVEESTGGEVGAGDVLENFGEAGLRIVDHFDRRVHDLGEVVGRDVGGHADGDAIRSVDDEVGDTRGENDGLGGALIEIGNHVDGFHFDVGHHFAGDFGHAAFGVPVSRGRIAIDGTEVALTVDERIAEGPGLRHADEGVVDGGVAVGMVFLQTFADDAGAFGIAFVVLHALAIHGGEDAAMDGLEAVAGIGERAPDDDGHGVVEIRAAHLLFNVDGDEAGCAWTGGTIGRIAVERKLRVLIVCHKFSWAEGRAGRDRTERATEDLSL